MKMINVRVLENRIKLGLVEGKRLENTQETLNKIKYRVNKVDAWILENNEGTFGTEIVVTKEGHVDLYLCIMEKYASLTSYIRVGNFQPEFGLGDAYLVNGKEVEYKKLGNIINALNKEYEKYGFYFDTTRNRSILASARKEYKLDQNEIKMRKLEEQQEEQQEVVTEPEKKSGFEVRVVNISTGETVQTMDAPNMRMAEKIESGVLRHLNTNDYYTEIVDLAQSKEIEIKTEKIVEKSEEKEMNTINKNALNNRMVKLGEFLKENTDKQAIENKVFELFPKAMEVEVFNNDNVVYFLVGQEYVGKEPTRKEMREKDHLFEIIDELYGLSVHVSVDDDKIKMDASIGVDYRDIYNNTHYTDCTVKEIEIELELTMETAKRKAEYIREMHTNEKVSATYAWDRIRELSLRETSDEVLDFLIEELTYYAIEEKKEKERDNVEHVQKTISKAHYLFAEGTVSVERILERLKRLYEYCHNDELKQHVDTAVALYEKAEDSMWREFVRKQVTELVEERQKAMVQRKIDKLEKAVTGRVSYEDARKILNEFAIYAKKEWKEDTKGYRVVTEPMRNKCYGVGNEKNITGGCEKIICTRGLQYGIEWREETNTMIIFVEGKLEYIKDGEVVTDEKHCIFRKEINCNPDPEGNKLDRLIKEYNQISHDIDVLKISKDAGEDCGKKIENKMQKLSMLQSQIQNIGGVLVVKYKYKRLNTSATGVSIFRTQEEVNEFEKNTEHDLEIKGVITVPKKSSYLDSNEESGDTPEEIKKEEIEHEYSKNTNDTESQKAYVLTYAGDVELFWSYEDAYKKMVELAKEVAKEWGYDHKLVIEDYGATVDIFKWTIVEKNIQ